MTSPFGQFGPIVATILGVGLVLAAIAVHIFPSLSGSANTDWIDNAALLVVGIAFGTRAGMNGAGAIAAAAHKRLDAIGAPPANDGVKVG